MKTFSFNSPATITAALVGIALLLLPSLCRAQSDTTPQAPSEVSGMVTTQDGKAVAGALVYGTTCCPTEVTHTDVDGRYRLQNPGVVLHIRQDGFDLALVPLTPDSRDVRVQLRPTSKSHLVRNCGKRHTGIRRIGWGDRGLQFDVPHELKIKGGNPDVDYVAYAICRKGAKECLELWLGPAAFGPVPDEDELLLRSINLSQKTITGVDGLDFQGELRDGTRWRHTSVFGEGGARYRNVSQENAKIYDGIIDSRCMVP